NSVEHARPGTGPAEPRIELAAQHLGTGLRITVTDCDPAPPQGRHTAPGDVDGRGLLLLQVLADAWGTETHDHGKTVWFTLGPPQGPPLIGATRSE
ncbi:ATP-binding protein, partial [Streptomyces antibioticus]|uniref:ATP-binding protein n=1 Tax=Streptomyces antibioticus TaxID=1890 RepID=UPI00340761D3